MPTDEGVVADTSPLLNLALIDRLELLRSQFSSITVPEAVRSELLAGEGEVDRLESFLESGFVTVTRPQRTDLVREFQTELDEGEAAAIALAIEHGAELVLIDERDGRQVARRHDLPVTGVVGVLLKAAERGELAIAPALDALRDAGFWIDDELYQQAIDAVDDGQDGT
ncbi:hypothetical protein C491_05301 [Natronococcus amylolyticus DSM 10524]|uniref:Nucleic acid-binding protein n=1 Tax=Natronococcus amylolyticus DSM 10524 TaxID=1227497 RepID=L9XGE9_9EURY|nr:DUF3368 domain-containing protein [Natronococcus amylolyticus]ELY59758.1 hypothetical protein C491_05301 [Natronococcus amylolyticus DSM 10524]